MSREIKFRAWNVFHGEMQSWEHLIGYCDIEYLFGKEKSFQEHEVIPMQYTGLKDKNGVEIYEGDIVEYLSDFTEKKSNHQVKYFGGDDYPAFDFSPSISDDMNGFSAIIYQEIGTVEVIGNIHQHPELLK